MLAVYLAAWPVDVVLEETPLTPLPLVGGSSEWWRALNASDGAFGEEEVGIGACCGLGHRLVKNLLTCAYALRRNKRCVFWWEGCSENSGRNVLESLVVLKDTRWRAAKEKDDAKLASEFFGNGPPNSREEATVMSWIKQPSRMRSEKLPDVTRLASDFYDGTKPDLVTKVDSFFGCQNQSLQFMCVPVTMKQGILLRESEGYRTGRSFYRTCCST